MITMKEYLEKALTENKGYLVFGNNRKEYLSKFDFEGKYQLGWTKDKKKAMVFPDKGSAKAALDRTLGSKFGSIIKEQKECPDGKVWCEMEQKCITKEEMEEKRNKKMDEASEVKKDELPEDKQQFIDKHFKNIDMKKSSFFHGIYGYVINPKEKLGINTRLTKKDISKLINDKNFRWLDISSIGF